MASFSRLPSLSVQLSLSLSFSPRLPQPSLHPRNADFRPQGLKSGWRGANYYGKENKTRREGGREEKEIENREGEKETDRCREGDEERISAVVH